MCVCMCVYMFNFFFKKRKNCNKKEKENLSPFFNQYIYKMKVAICRCNVQQRLAL